MPFQTQALNELAATIQGAASAAAQATTAVAGKQTVGGTLTLDAAVVTSDTTLDPSLPFWVLDGSGGPVTLTLPPVASVDGQQFTFTCVDDTNAVTLATDSGGEFLFLAGKPANSTRLISGMTLVLVARASGFPAPVWTSQGIINPNPPTDVFVFDTTSTGQSVNLPDASSHAGLLRAYKNAGTGGHAVVVSPAGTDTIDGGTGAVVITDSNIATFIRDDSTATNWVSILTAGGTFPTAVQAFAEDTTSADVPVTLPLALTSGGLLVLYKNTGTGGHNVLVSRTGSDTIDGAGTGPAVVDGQWAGFVREDGSTTNWVSVVEPVITPPVIPPAAVASDVDTTSADVPVTLPAASASVGTIVAYHNSSGSHFVVVSPAGSDVIDTGPASVAISAGNFGAFVAVSTTEWVSLVPPVAARPRAEIQDTSSDLSGTLPAAATSTALYSFRNNGTGGHTLTINPNGSDTINGSGTGIIVPDGKAASFVVENGSTTNWVLISLA